MPCTMLPCHAESTISHAHANRSSFLLLGPYKWEHQKPSILLFLFPHPPLLSLSLPTAFEALRRRPPSDVTASSAASHEELATSSPPSVSPSRVLPGALLVVAGAPPENPRRLQPSSSPLCPRCRRPSLRTLSLRPCALSSPYLPLSFSALTTPRCGA